MSKVNRNQEGFTLIEILIILIVIGILAAIVFNSYSVIKARQRNDTRRTDITTLQNYIERFYSQNLFYPSLADLNSSLWRANNLSGLPGGTIQDPSWNPKSDLCSARGTPVFLEKPQIGCYGYNPTNSGISCESSDKSCNEYTLSAELEQGAGVYTKVQLD